MDDAQNSQTLVKADPCAYPSRVWQQLSDRIVPWRRSRWVVLAVLASGFTARVAHIARQFFVAYVLAIYVFQQLLLFISPAVDDSELEAMASGGEYRPFVRALSEFLLWQRAFCAAFVCFIVTFFDALDVDVDGACLLLFFALLFFYTMRQQIQHMVKFRYVPWSVSKQAASRREKKDAYDV